MGWSDGIDMMAQSSNEMRVFFFSLFHATAEGK